MYTGILRVYLDPVAKFSVKRKLTQHFSNLLAHTNITFC